MVNFNLVKSFDMKQKTREDYFKILDKYSIRPDNQINNAINYLVSAYSGVFTFSIGKYKNIPEIIIAIQDKQYYEWYLETIVYPKNICWDISNTLYKILYGE